MSKALKSIFIIALAQSFMGCGSPKSYLDDYIKEKGFIPYVLKMDDTGVGTFYTGGNKSLQLVQEAETCMSSDHPEPFRKTINTDLPSEYKKVELGFNAEVNDALKSGSSSLSLNLSASHVKTVKIEFGEAKIETLISDNLLFHYRTGMSARCKNLLENNAFVTKSLRVDSMRFSFESKSGGFIDLDANIDEVVDIDADVSWEIENKYTLVINSPKDVGYNMARLNSKGDLDYAVETDSNGHWIFKAARDLFFKSEEFLHLNKI